jgi:hypothetical protein
VLACAAKIASGEAVRDDIPDGYTASGVEVMIAAKIGGQVYREQFLADINVGHASVRASSVNPDMGQVLGLILSKLNTATRDKILADLPAEFAANGCELPEVDAGIAEAAAAMLKKMRASKSQDVRGSVSVKYQSAPAALSLVG